MFQTALAKEEGYLIDPESSDSSQMSKDSKSDGDKVIYGSDDRIEPFMLDGSPAHVATKKIVDSEVILVTSNKLQYNSATRTYSISSVFRSKWTTRGGYPLCANEPFYGQVNIGYCSGFLVGVSAIAMLYSEDFFLTLCYRRV